jgi:hypothetical protein
MNLLFDGRGHVLREQLLLFQGFPCGYGRFRRVGGDLPQRACWDSRRVSEASHLVAREFGKAAAAAEIEGERVFRKVRPRRDKIISGGQDR